MWAGVDSVWEQEKLEARKMLENAAESHTSGARFVSWHFIAVLLPAKGLRLLTRAMIGRQVAFDQKFHLLVFLVAQVSCPSFLHLLIHNSRHRPHKDIGSEPPDIFQLPIRIFWEKASLRQHLKKKLVL